MRSLASGPAASIAPEGTEAQTADPKPWQLFFPGPVGLSQLFQVSREPVWGRQWVNVQAGGTCCVVLILLPRLCPQPPGPTLVLGPDQELW